MVTPEGFTPIALDMGTPVPMPRWERNLVIIALFVHVCDVVLDVLVALLFLTHLKWAFFFGSAGVILWAWLVSSLYVSFGGGQGSAPGDLDDGGVAERLPHFLMNFAQVQIFAEAYRCIRHGWDTDYFHTLRLLEAILESAPSSLVQLYALVVWASTEEDAPGAGPLLRTSVIFSFISVGLGLAMWEQKVQFRTPSSYVGAVAIFRFFEIASRSLTLALFAALTRPTGFYWSLIADYAILVFLIVQHRSVQFTYGLFVALPLVLVSLEPLVWRREDHAVPKDAYYMVRVAEFVLMWTVIIYRQDDDPLTLAFDGDSAWWLKSEVLAFVATLGLYATLPFVWRVARRHELSRDVADWDEDGRADGLTGEEAGLYSESESGEDDDAQGDRRGPRSGDPDDDGGLEARE